MKTNSKLLLILGIAILILIAFIIFVPYHPPTVSVTSSSTPSTSGQVCTQEAKLCPDGSYVGRTGPNCEFALCPAVNTPASWKSSTENGVTFFYPPDLSTDYIRPVDWPPSLQVVDPTSCTESGSVSGPAGKTVQKTIGNRSYCVTEEIQGAAGSIYYQYAYGTIVGSGEVILTFSLQYPQCANYPEPKKTTCQSEEDSFNIDPIIDQIVSTLQ